jgi:hypothetical protein
MKGSGEANPVRTANNQKQEATFSGGSGFYCGSDDSLHV